MDNLFGEESLKMSSIKGDYLFIYFVNMRLNFDKNDL